VMQEHSSPSACPSCNKPNPERLASFPNTNGKGTLPVYKCDCGYAFWEDDEMPTSQVESTKNTALNLLTQEGAVACFFEPELTAEQYDTLFDFVQRAETKAELESYLRRFADKWQMRVTVDGNNLLSACQHPRSPAASPLK
jgi:hypothetical protein